MTRSIDVSIAHSPVIRPVVPTPNPAPEDAWCTVVETMLEARTREVASLLHRIGALEARIRELEASSRCNG